MKILIFGGTGFIGSHLIQKELIQEHEICVVSRRPESARKKFKNKVDAVAWEGKATDRLLEKTEWADAIINLAGENLAKLWTKKNKEKIERSRVGTGLTIAQLVNESKNKPQVVLQGSAIGYYGSDPDATFNEDSAPGKGFLADVTDKWEDSLDEIRSESVRKVFLRTGLVLAKDGGVLPKMIIPMKLFVGGPIGSGQQWMSWIHLRDEIRAVRFLLENESMKGPYNLTAPNPVQQKDFADKLGEALDKPSWLPVPAFVLEMAMGQMADEMLLASQRVIPDKLLDAGFEFIYTRVDEALKDIFPDKN